MSWIRDRLGISESNNNQEEDKYGIRARLGISKSASTTKQTDNLSTQRKIAADVLANRLAESRQNFQNYMNEETKEARSQKITIEDFKPSKDLKTIKNELYDLATKNAQARDAAVKSEKGQALKQDIREKQSDYNYAAYLENKEATENTNYNLLQKLTNPITSGIGDLLQVDRLDPESQYYYDAEGNKSYLPTKRSLEKQAIRKQSTGALGVYNDVAYNLSKSVSSKVLDMFTGGAGSMLYYGDMMIDSTEEAKKQGFNNKEALAYGTGVTILGKVLDNVIGTFGGLSNAQKDIPTLSQGLDKLFLKLTTNKTAATILSNVGSEAISEYAEEYADNALKYIIGGDKTEYDSFMDMLGKTAPDALYAGLIGGISGGIGGTVENLKGDVEIAERKQALEDYKNTLENYKPQTVAEANYKEDQLTKVENTLEQIEQQEEVQTESVQEEIKQPAKTEEIASKEEVTSEDASKEEVPKPNEKSNINIIESINPKKKGQLQLDLDTIQEKGKQLNVPEKQITYKKSQSMELNNNLTTKDTSMEKAIATGNVEVTKNGGLKKTINERATDDVMKFVIPTDKKVSVKTNDIYGNEVSMKKMSTAFLQDVQNNSQLIDKLENNKTTSQKAQDKRDTLKLEQAYAKRKATIKDDKRRTEYEKTEADHMFKSLSLDELEQKWADELLSDFDKVDEEFKKNILNNTSSPDVIAQGTVLMKYYQSKGDWVTADEYHQKISSALHNPAVTVATGKLLYEDTPIGAYSAYMKAIEDTYKEDAKYHKNDIEWHKKNDLYNPDGSVNENSPYRLSKEVKNDLGAKIQEWYNIENPNSKEAKIKQKEINTLIKNNLPDKPFVEKLMDFRKSSMLNSIGIWIKNSRQELIDVSNAVITDIGASPSDVWLSKLRNKIENEVRIEQGEEQQQKRYRSTSIQTVSGKEFIDGYKNGVKNHWEGIKNDIVLTRFDSRYSDNLEHQSNKRISNETKINRRSTSKAQVFLDKVNAIGMGADSRFAEAYYAQSLYDQQSQFALNMASNTGSKSVVRTEVNNAGATITYADPDTLTLHKEVVPNITDNNKLLEYLTENKYVMPSEKDIDSMLDRASQIGSYRTMQDNGAFTKFTSKLIKLIDDQSVEHLGVPLGSTIAPFYRASTESIRTFVKSTPLAAISINKKIKEYKQAVRDNATGVKANNLFDMQYSLAKDMGQAIGGTTAMVIAGVIAKTLSDKGILIGNNPDKKEDEEKYSIKIGDKNYSFDIDTVTTTGLKFISVLSDNKNISQKETNSIVKNIETTFSNLGSPLLDTVLEQTALSTFAEYSENKYGTTWDNVWYQLSRIPGSFVPTLSKNLASAFDGFTSRDTSSDTLIGKAINNIGGKIPIVRSMYEEKKDKWSSPEDATLNIFEKAWNSIIGKEISANASTAVDKELYNLYTTTGSTGLFPSTGLENTFSIEIGGNKQTYNLSKEEQKAYQSTYGQKAFDTLQKLFNTSSYEKANAKDKATMVRAAYTYSKEYAQQKYLDTKDIYYDKKETAIEKVINQDISYTSAQYQKDNPERWKLYTSIIPDYDDYKNVANTINDIKKLYGSGNGFSSATKKNMVVNYVNNLSHLTATQKAMLIKISGFQSSYSDYDNQIVEYLRSLNLTEKEYDYFAKSSNLGLKGYYVTFHKNK